MENELLLLNTLKKINIAFGFFVVFFSLIFLIFLMYLFWYLGYSTADGKSLLCKCSTNDSSSTAIVWSHMVFSVFETLQVTSIQFNKKLSEKKNEIERERKKITLLVMHAQSVVVATRECFFPKSISCRLLLMLLLLVNSSCASSWYIGIDTFDFFFLLLLLSFDHAPWNEHSAVHIMCQLKYGKILIWNWKRANSGKNVFSENTF